MAFPGGPLVVRLAVVALLLVAGCSSSNSSSPRSVTTADPLVTTATTESATVGESTPSTGADTAVGFDDVTAALVAWLTAVGEVTGSDPLDSEPLDGLAVPEVIESTLAPIELGRANLDWLERLAEFEVQPSDVVVDGATATWAGCVASRFVAEGPEPLPGDRLLIERVSAQLAIDGPTIVLTSYDVVADRCLPVDHGLDTERLEDDAIAALSAPSAYLDPPVVDEELVRQHRTGELVDGGVALAQSMLDQGLGFRATIEVRDVAVLGMAFGVVIVRSCEVLGADYGVYDLESGAPVQLDGVDEPGTEVTRTSQFVEEGGTWKMMTAETVVGISCSGS